MSGPISIGNCPVCGYGAAVPVWEEAMNTEPICVRGVVVYAERIYTSDRRDYIVYRHRGRIYYVRAG